MQQRSLPLPSVLGPGIAAGLAGAVAIAAYAIVVFVLGTHSMSLTSFYQYVASGAIGQAAYAGTSGAIIGVVLHLAIGMLWGAGYAYAAARTPQILARPLVSGIVFGLVVMVAMQIVEVAANIYTHLPSTFELVNALVAHIAFFGLPIAYIVSWKLGSRP
jgi:hypothetical protein